MKCLRFTEYNDWEGETWHFFVDICDDIEARLRSLLASGGMYSEQYTLSEHSYERGTVNILVNESDIDDDCTYLPKYSYIGELTSLPDVEWGKVDPFYKGNLREYCTSRDLNS